MSVLVTGAYGQLGSELCRQLGSRAAGLDIDTLDLTDPSAIEKTLRRLGPEFVINCAADTQVDQAESRPELCWAVNATAVEHLARVCCQLDCPLVQISSDYVFGGGPSPGRPYREDDPPAPQGVYARSKLAGEKAAAGWAKHLIIRTCGLYTRAGQRRAKNFVTTVLDRARCGLPLRVVADQHCTPSYVPHVARAIVFLAGLAGNPAAPWGIYHVTNRGQTTWHQFAREVLRLAGIQADLQEITAAEYGAPALRPVYSVLDTAAYHRLGGPAMPHWQAALAEYFAD